MNFEQVSEFKKELKKLHKKWRSLPNDIKDAQLLIKDIYTSNDQEEYRKAFFNGKRAALLQKTDNGREVVKMRLDVASLSSDAKVRIVFIAIIEDSTVLFIELYAKNDKDREDLERIKKYL
jgi:hypothetical protein